MGSDEEYGFSPMERMRAERDAAIAERDRLREELEELRHTCRRSARVSAVHEDALTPLADRLDAILSGGES